ncbi:MAG: xanthine dehydrogenase family protein molybdopterin-binding subunit [Alphaproteobacteria bacterium]|nr:xanthine dehydrogenase family protein molybdopterin-binding subunit [Alphaproteobacteria bacterium]
MTTTKFGVGQSVHRVEDPRFLRGEGCYVDDIVLPRQAYAYVLRSPHAHAEIARIDTIAARDLAGVLAVLTGADARADGLGEIPCLMMPSDRGLTVQEHKVSRPILAGERVRHVGEPVAVIVAESLAIARDAAELIEIDYDARPASISIEAARAEAAALVWPTIPRNLAWSFAIGDEAATNAAFARAHHVTRLDITNNRITANSLEPRGAIGVYSRGDDRYTLYSSAQNPHRLRPQLAHFIFRQPETKFRVIARDVGGGFGMKGTFYPEEALVVWAARKVGRPVKWIGERSESLISDTHGRDQRCRGALALDADGRILALRTDSAFDIGAYMTTSGGITSVIGTVMMPNVYRIPAMWLRTEGVMTHSSPTAPYRGAGGPEAIYVIEALIDQAAVDLGLDPVEIRRRNFIPAGSIPFTTLTGLVYDSGEYETLLDKTVALADWGGFATRRAGASARGRHRGIGLCYYVEMTAILNDRMEIRFDPGGNVTIVAGTLNYGQGHETVFAQMVADWLGVPFETIRLINGDTDQVSFGRGSFGSRSMTVGGSALRGAADRVIERGRKLAAHFLEAAEADIAFADGGFAVVGTDRAISLTRLAQASYAPNLPDALGLGIEGVGTFMPETPNFPNGCHICEVEVDPDTGTVEIVRYSIVDDVGRTINPMLLHGQVHGGVAQGIGQALMEHVVYERESGQLLAGSFMDYCMPRADDMPFFTVGAHDTPCTTNPLGVKGAGEAGCVGAPPAVVGAILNALRPLGVRHLAMPATPERVWQAIRTARSA